MRTIASPGRGVDHPGRLALEKLLPGLLVLAQGPVEGLSSDLRAGLGDDPHHQGASHSGPGIFRAPMLISPLLVKVVAECELAS